MQQEDKHICNKQWKEQNERGRNRQMMEECGR